MSSSWWVNVPPYHWSAEVRAHESAMRSSRFGQLYSSGTYRGVAGETAESARRPDRQSQVYRTARGPLSRPDQGQWDGGQFVMD